MPFCVVKRALLQSKMAHIGKFLIISGLWNV